MFSFGRRSKNFSNEPDGSKDVNALNRIAAESIYKSSPNGEFRIVLIRPSKSRSAGVQCSLRRLKFKRSYETLSYRWGPTKQNLNTITLDGEKFYVTQNLYSALVQLRRKDTSRAIWIDALAINQTNPDDKKLQIPAMARIYGNASQTIAWLGDMKETHLLTLMRYLKDKNEAEIASSIARNAVGTKSFKMWSLRSDWLEFIRLEYWSRVWIVQEILLSKHVIVQFGDRTLELDEVGTFGRAVNGLLKPGYWKANDLALRYLGVRDQTVFNYDPNDNLGWFLQPPAQDIRSIFSFRIWALQLCPNTKCQDPKDKVFGFHALFPQEVRDELTVDYAIDLHELFRRVTEAFCARTSDLLCLNLVQEFGCAESDGKVAPSWVPDYSIATLVAAERFRLCHTRYPQPPPVVPVSFSTSPERRSLLHTVALPLAKCVEQCDYLPSTKDVDRIVVMVCNYHLAISQLVRHGEPTAGFTLAFLGSQWPTRDVSDFTSLVDEFQGMDLASISRKMNKSTRTRLERLFGSKQYVVHHLHRRMFRFSSSIPLQRPYPQDRNDAIGFGIGSPIMKPGDRTFLIPSCDLPVILRQDGDTYEVVGNAYLPDFREDWIDQGTELHLKRETTPEHVVIR